MNFSLNDVNGVSNSQPRLKAWEIHDVILKNISFNSFIGKKDPSQKYQVMKIRFENENGYYEETVFCPKEGDEVRRVTQVGETQKEQASNLERLKFLLAHLGEQLSPDKYAKFKGQSWELPKDFEKMVDTFIKVMQPAFGKSTKLKLIGNKKGEPSLPFFVNVNKDGVAYISNNFLGSKAFFTPYELTTMEKYQSAKPTEMAQEPESSDKDLDFDILK